MAMSDQTKAQKWIAVAQQLMADLDMPLRCPFCDEASLCKSRTCVGRQN
jgi:cytochrome c-type biogenesis protein CcmH/NrfF